MSRISFILNEIKQYNPELKDKTEAEIIERLKGIKKLVLIKVGSKDNVPTMEVLINWEREFRKYATTETQFLILPNAFETETILLKH